MSVQRFVGAAWAAVHGPSEATRLLRWVLEAKFSGIVAGPSPRAVDWAGLAAGASSYPVGFPAVRASSVLADRPATAGLVSAREADRAVAIAAIERAVSLGAVLGTHVVIVDPGVVPLIGDVGPEDLGDPAQKWTEEAVQAMSARRKAGRNAALDHLCRVLFALGRRWPETTFCLTAGRSLRSMATISDLQAVFEDLPRTRLGYWHDAGLVARRQQVIGEAQGAWLEAFSNLCLGMDLGDAGDAGVYLLPGAGGVDYPLVSSYLRRTGTGLPACLELDPAVSPAELPGIRACLDKYGL